MSRLSFLFIVTSLLQLSTQEEDNKGPVCYACAGVSCGLPRVKGHDPDIHCDVGHVCWTIATLEKEVTYFRGCGFPNHQKCAGGGRKRAPARSTAGQRLEVNGDEYCEWGSGISQCKTCCEGGWCNGGEPRVRFGRNSSTHLKPMLLFIYCVLFSLLCE
uniref:Uncharacterized LOC100177297 n=1 Tax=Ciona intestinalis TaxID=7719 RepID=F6U393_CIOIN|nr:uncharacterized protein LOC100177297 [Ciona intestinalis]|eukprot:XP_002129343.1 uncharacterized protein LOC100177297 [Ciona intestinalis]